MPKITRQTFIQFGQNVNAAADICQFGSPATGSPVYTNVISILQALAAWTTGFAAETVANNRPFLEDFNAFCYVFSYMIAYLLEMGIPEWDSGTTYYTNSIVQYGGICYQSIIDNNLNITPAIGGSWKTLKMSSQLGSWATLSLNTIYQASSDGYVMSSQSGTVADLTAYTSSSTPPSSSPSAIAYSYLGTVVMGGEVFLPVRKGDYFEVVVTIGSPTVYFISQGQ